MAHRKSILKNQLSKISLQLQTPLPGFFITGTDTNVGKTVIGAAIAQWFVAQNKKVMVLKPVASGCVRTHEGLVSEDAELLRAASNTHHPLDLICPNRYAEPLAPHVAALREKRPMDWDAVQHSMDVMSRDADVMIIEGAGGIMVPLDEQTLVLDVIIAMKLPVVVVARAGLGTINHTVLTVQSLRAVGARVAGVVINHYPVNKPGTAEQTNPQQIARIAQTPVLCLVPAEPFTPPHLSAGITSAVAQVNWTTLLNP
jgi:dethiobiotin synthetase